MEGEVLKHSAWRARRPESSLPQAAVSVEKVGHQPTTTGARLPARAILRDAELLGLSLEWRCSILLQVISHLGRSLYVTIGPFCCCKIRFADLKP